MEETNELGEARQAEISSALDGVQKSDNKLMI